MVKCNFFFDFNGLRRRAIGSFHIMSYFSIKVNDKLNDGVQSVTRCQGGFLRVATCLWRCDFARSGFVLGRSTRNSTLGRMDQWLLVHFWVYKIDETQSLRIMIMVEINNMLSMIVLIKWWDNTLLLCILSDVQY